MKKFKWVLLGVVPFMLTAVFSVKVSWAAGWAMAPYLDFLDSADILTGRFAAVEGDKEKFRLHHWMKDGYAGGFKEISLDHQFPQDAAMSWEGHAVPQENDIESSFFLDKKDRGYFKTDYKAFRKYFDGTGGYYRNFLTFSGAQLNQDLKMDIGDLAVEVGPYLGDSGLSFLYEQHTKDGRKSRLAWTPVKEGQITRNVGPSWQDLDEVTNVFALRGKTALSGFDVSGEQRFETVHITSLREEASLATTGVAADTKIRRQDQEPTANLLTSTLQAQRWIFNDKAFVNLGYRYYQLRNEENETLAEFTAAGVPQSFSNPKNKFNANADNQYDAHSWVGHFTSTPMKDLNLATRLKTEVIKRRGHSVYPSDTTNPPDGIANTTEVSNTENSIVRTGENFSVRYTGLPRTAVYSELELEQTRNWITEERNSIAGQSGSDANETFFRETLTNIGKAVWTLGARAVPVRSVNVTTQIRHRLEQNDYDDINESNPGGSTALSAFFDALNVNGDEATFRVTWKPYSWLQPAFRYQYIDNKYISRAENQVEQESRSVWNVFTYDLSLQPTERLLVTTSFSRQNIATTTPAGAAAATQIPGFDSNVDTALLSTSYTIKDNLSFFNTILYSKAGKFNDYSDRGLPLGLNSDRYDFTLGMRWSPRQDWTVEPRYAYYQYDAHQSSEVGDYKAHVVWLDTSWKW